jgi:hypothetical protein
LGVRRPAARPLMPEAGLSSTPVVPSVNRHPRPEAVPYRGHALDGPPLYDSLVGPIGEGGGGDGEKQLARGEVVGGVDHDDAPSGGAQSSSSLSTFFPSFQSPYPPNPPLHSQPFSSHFNPPTLPILINLIVAPHLAAQATTNLYQARYSPQHSKRGFPPS